MAKNKTFETTNSVADYIEAIADDKRKADFSSILELFQTQTGLEPAMWGTSIVGFGSYAYKYESGHEGTAPLVGLSSRANAITLYLSTGFEDREALLGRLGKHKTGKGCIYIQKLQDINSDVLATMIRAAYSYAHAKYKS
ncbi:MAG: DUF1801 domain-containing protein [Spirosomataceae bacterium]